jgi:uncharacterized protein
MKSGLLNANGSRTYALIFEKEDEFIDGMKRFAEAHNIDASHFTALGAFSRVTLEFFSRDKMGYEKIPVEEQVEVLSLIGNITRSDHGPKVHAHAVVGLRDGSTMGGHIGEGTVWPTLEVVITEEPVYIRRKEDSETGLDLIDLQVAG